MDWDAIYFNTAAFVAGLVLLEFGADKFIDHTAIVARRLGVSQTLVALLTAGAEWEEVLNTSVCSSYLANFDPVGRRDRSRDPESITTRFR